MRIVWVSLTLAVTASCVVDPAPVAPAPVSRSAPPSPAPPVDALALIETSPTLDGPPLGARADGTLVVVFASWCGHCRDQFALIGSMLDAHPRLRVVGVNYRRHEEYDDLGDSMRVRAYVAEHAPWLVVVPADERLFVALGRPAKVPTMYLYDRGGRVTWRYDRRLRPPPTAVELDTELTRLGI